MSNPRLFAANSTVICLIVTYKPSILELKNTLDVLGGQVDKILIIDNFSGGSSRKELQLLLCAGDHENCELILLDKNHGLAYAQNVGIDYALKHNYDFTLLLDQDSSPHSEFVNHLLHVFFDTELMNVAIVGPVIQDRRLSFNSPACEADKVHAIKKDFIIASGSLIKATALLEIGGMAEALFIDHIDHEWCFRARSFGYEIYESPQATLSHALGDKVISMWLFGRKNVSIHSPLRNYYKVRNAIYLCSLKYIPIRWRLFFLLQSIKVSVFSVLVAGERRKRLHYLYMSLRDGIRSRLGNLDDQSD
ncbi:glycosyltransferase family 2 protein [Pseudomonas helmanticensis]|uniref:glycosyltransferase family 2 protein n=1 Tax=Pseudomonas helmanticensis TaxID=1471381 RepID=UPI0037F585E4